MKFVFSKKDRYTENTQNNPMKWRLLFREADGVFSDQGDWMKCKDFFNDVVSALRGKHFTIYGFDNSKVKKNDEGVYILVNSIKNQSQFLDNIVVVNERLVKDLGCTIVGEKVPGVADQVVLLFPPKLWETTYYISLATFMVRLCNYGVSYKSWEDFFKTDSPCRQFEYSAMKPDQADKATKEGFIIPEKFRKYWWFAGGEYNSEGKWPEKSEYIVHNNGFSNWNYFFTIQ